jgi:hypothetical protein
MNRVVKAVRPLALGAALFALAPNDASAQNVRIYGNAKACFGLGCTPTENALAVYGGFTGTWVTYNSSWVDFGGLSQDGSLPVNGVTGDFGTIRTATLFGSDNVNSAFTLLLSFYSPLTPDILFREVALTGNLSANPTTGALMVNFDGGNAVSPWVPFVDVLSNPDQVGEMRVAAYTTAIPVDGKNELTGRIELRNVTASPEPASMLLMASGLAGVAAIKRRRKQANRQM